MTTIAMKLIALLSGNFSANGNFSGYNAAGLRVFVSGRQMESLGYTPESVATTPIKFPLYAIGVEREFNVLDDEGKPTEETFTRLQAGSVFTDKASAIAAYNESGLLTVEANVALQKEAKAAGLTDAQIAELAAVTL